MIRSKKSLGYSRTDWDLAGWVGQCLIQGKIDFTALDRFALDLVQRLSQGRKGAGSLAWSIRTLRSARYRMRFLRPDFHNRQTI